LRLAIVVLAALAGLLAYAALVGARPALTHSVAPQLRLSTQLNAGLGEARAAVPGWRATLAARRAVDAKRQTPKLTPELEPAPAPVEPVAVSLQPGVVAPQPQPEPSSPPAPKPPSPPAPKPPPPGPAPEPPPPPPPPAPGPEPTEPPLLQADFEEGLKGWSTAGVGDVVPRVTGDIVRDGEKAVAVRLTGEQDRSELILGGNGGGSTAGTVRFYEGDEYYYAFSFYIESMVYGEPGAHNLIMQFKSDGEGSPDFGLQLWDYAGDDGRSGGRGLWSHGDAMGGDRFLAPVPERVWHDVLIHFRASSQGAGFYEVYLDGQSIDSRTGVSMIVPGHGYAYIKDGLYRNGEEIPGTSEIRLDAARLGETLESVQVQP
jgi:polysaccharide lyase-like protein